MEGTWVRLGIDEKLPGQGNEGLVESDVDELGACYFETLRDLSQERTEQRQLKCSPC